MIDTLIKATVLLAVVALAALLLRRSSASLRHLLWTLGIVGLVAIPVLATTLPFRLPILPTASVSTPPIVDRAVTTTASEATETREVQGQVHVPPPHADQESIEGTATLSKAPLPWARILVGAWLTVMLALLTRFMVGLVIVQRIARRAAVVTDASWTSMAGRAARALDVKEPVELRMSDEVAMPFACGPLNPVVVIPSSAAEWSAERREAVLLHELAHISRGDLAMNMLSHVVRAIYWFHPLAWLASHRLRVEGERSCDDAVLRAGALPSDYAEHLLSIVRTVGSPIPTAAVAMARRSEFEGRLLAILEPGLPRGRMTRWHAGAVAALFLLSVMPLAAMGPARNENSATENSATENSATENSAAAVAAITKNSARVMQQQAPPAQQPPAQSVQQPGGAVTALIEAVGDASATVRMAAVSSLGALGDPRAIAALSKALKEDSDPRVREAAAEALGQIDDTRAVPALLDALKSERAETVKEQIVEALGEIDDPSAVSGISALAKDPSVRVRRAVASALGELEDPSAVPALLSMTRDEDVEVRRQTASALSNFENPAAIEPLLAMARDSDAEVRQQSLSALSDFEDARLLPAYVAALKDPNANVRHEAAHAIGNLDDLKKAPPALIDALADNDKEVRQAAADALGSIGDEAAVPGLKRLTTDSDVEVRRSAAEALSDIGGVEAIQALMGLLKDQDPEIRKVAAEALGKRRGE